MTGRREADERMADGFALSGVGACVLAHLHLHRTVARVALGVKAEAVAAIAFGVVGYLKAAHVAAFEQRIGERVEQELDVADTVDVIVLVNIAEVSRAPAAGSRLLAHPDAAEGLADARPLRVDVRVERMAEEAFEHLGLAALLVNHGPDGEDAAQQLAVAAADVKAAVGKVAVVAPDPRGDDVFLAPVRPLLHLKRHAREHPQKAPPVERQPVESPGCSVVFSTGQNVLAQNTPTQATAEVVFKRIHPEVEGVGFSDFAHNGRGREWFCVGNT